jgi:hypothetical protein
MTLSSSGAQFRRNIMHLCMVPHIRAAHRRTIVEEARAKGIQQFRLEVPRDRRSTINPKGWIGRHVWTVRTIAEWLELADAYHAQRGGSAHDWVSMGIHHGDYTYLIPVPHQYVAEAIADGQRLRREHGLTQRRAEAAA